MIPVKFINIIFIFFLFLLFKLRNCLCIILILISINLQTKSLFFKLKSSYNFVFTQIYIRILSNIVKLAYKSLI